MTYTITNQCIECGRCLPLCPTGAIHKTHQRYEVNPTLCNNCAGHYTIAQCWSVCPTNDGCIPHVIAGNSKQDYWQWWFTTYHHKISQLRGEKDSQYWDHWFNRYAQKISKLLQSEHQAIGA